MRALIRQLEEAKKDSGFATRKDLEALGYDNDAFKTGVPALVKKTLGPGLTAVDRGLAQGGIFTFRDSFFYKGNRTADDLGNRIVSELAKKGYAAKVLATGENSAAFVGGADPWSAKSSFFWVVLQVKSKQQPGASAQEEAAGGSIAVNTDGYERSHSKFPRGKGNWGFGIGTADPDMSGKAGDLFWANTTYAEAVKAAKAQAKKRGVDTVYVMP